MELRSVFGPDTTTLQLSASIFCHSNVNHALCPIPLSGCSPGVSVVLKGWSSTAFKSMACISIYLLSWNVAFLVAITSERGTSKLSAHYINALCMLFHKSMIVLWLSPFFLPKEAAEFTIPQRSPCNLFLDPLFISRRNFVITRHPDVSSISELPNSSFFWKPL